MRYTTFDASHRIQPAVMSNIRSLASPRGYSSKARNHKEKQAPGIILSMVLRDAQQIFKNFYLINRKQSFVINKKNIIYS